MILRIKKNILEIPSDRDEREDLFSHFSPEDVKSELLIFRFIHHKRVTQKIMKIFGNC
jgi:hypothetical protein